MDRPVGHALRWARAGVLAAVALLTAVAAHVAADGLVPGPLALGSLLAVCWLTAARALGRPASTTRIVLLLVMGQTFIHGSLTALSGHRGDPPLMSAHRMPPSPLPAAYPIPTTTDGRRVGSFMDQMNAVHPITDAPVQLTVPAPVQHLIADMSGSHAAMALAHLVATVLLGWWLAQGERMLWTVLSLTADGARDSVRMLGLIIAGGRLASRAVDTPVPAPDGPMEVWSGSLGLAGRALAASVVRRGPPSPCLV